MHPPVFYYIMAFQTTTEAMQAEKYAKEHISITIMPTPREISSGCRLSIRFMESDEQKILLFCQNFPIRGSLYKMNLQKTDGHRSVVKLMDIVC